MAKGLDVGTMNIVCSEMEGDNVVFVQQRNAFLELDYSDLTKMMLDNANVQYVIRGDKIYILGDDALKFATVFKKPIRRPMKSGILSPEEKEAVPIIKLILEKVLGTPSYEGEIVCISSPANPIDSDIEPTYHRKTLEALVKKMGYQPFTIDEGLAVVYSELAENSFTGIGISFGAGLTNVTAAYFAAPIVSFSIARGGDWIDEHASKATGMPKEQVCSFKEMNFELKYEVELGSVEGALAIYYDYLITYVVENLRRKLSEVTPPQVEFPVVLAGGTAKPKGFKEAFEEKISKVGLPVEVSKIKIAKDPLFSVARGCLIAAKTKES
jgi:actin-like ATPase involved in cell morphogenesis